MRLLYIIDSLFPGGACRSLAAVAPYLVAEGVELDVAYLFERPGLHEEFEAAGARLFPLTGSTRLGRWARAAKLIGRRRPDLVHTTLFEADVAGRIAGSLGRVPVVCSLVGLPYGPEQLGDPALVGWKVRAAGLVDATTAQTVRRFHALSGHVADVMAVRLRVPRKRIEVVPRGRDPERLGIRTDRRREEARRSLGIGAQEVIVLGAARQEFQKGLDILLDAFPTISKRMPGTRLILCGRDGVSSPALREKAARLGNRVMMLGARDDVFDLMCAADALAVPSRWEPLGGVLLEAMALETPIVASDLPAVREVLDQGRCGRLVPPERPEALAEGIVATLSDREGSRRVAGLARDRFLNLYTVDRISPKMMDFYRRALNSGARHRAGSLRRSPGAPRPSIGGGGWPAPRDCCSEAHCRGSSGGGRAVGWPSSRIMPSRTRIRSPATWTLSARTAMPYP
jgi:glycosyltransferase involved in cell wall biosynthesis